MSPGTTRNGYHDGEANASPKVGLVSISLKVSVLSTELFRPVSRSLAFLPVSISMSESPAFYIVTVAGGKCLENTKDGVLNCVPKESDPQKWILEASDEDPNSFAIKSCSDGRYLINKNPTSINWAKIGMQEEKQLWTLEKGRFPRSCFIRSSACTAGASYLNDFNGEYKDNHYVHMWQMDVRQEFHSLCKDRSLIYG